MREAGQVPRSWYRRPPSVASPPVKSLCAALREKDGDLHMRLLQLNAAAVLPACVTPLRVFDVIARMEGKAQGL